MKVNIMKLILQLMYSNDKIKLIETTMGDDMNGYLAQCVMAQHPRSNIILYARDGEDKFHVDIDNEYRTVYLIDGKLIHGLLEIKENLNNITSKHSDVKIFLCLSIRDDLKILADFILEMYDKDIEVYVFLDCVTMDIYRAIDKYKPLSVIRNKIHRRNIIEECTFMFDDTKVED